MLFLDKHNFNCLLYIYGDPLPRLSLYNLSIVMNKDEK